jgi:hypothetical protein
MIFLALGTLALCASADSLVYVVTDTQQLGVADLQTGAFNQIATLPEGSANLVPGPSGSLLSLAFSGDLLSINPSTGATTAVATALNGSTGWNSALDLAEVNGVLYATDYKNNLYTIDPSTGATHLLGATGIPAFTKLPLTTNPDGTVNLGDESLYGVGGKLYATFDQFTEGPSGKTFVTAPALYEISPSTLATTSLGSTLPNLSASVYVNGTFYAFQEGLAHAGCVGPSPVPCPSVATTFTLDLSDGATTEVSSLNHSATAIYGAAPVPEPASITMAILGLNVVASYAWWRRRDSRVSRDERGNR